MHDDDKEILERMRNRNFLEALERFNEGPLDDKIYEKYGFGKKKTRCSLKQVADNANDYDIEVSKS
ncbi:MAG: hypothetical protein FWE45_03810 [Firmicutes bacterium]|nr:hypothetical protein [Bacillota bacterium]